MALQIELREAGIEPQIDVIGLIPCGVLHEGFLAAAGRFGALSQDGGEKLRAVVGQGGLVARPA